MEAPQQDPSMIAPVILTGEKNPRGIPATIFIEDVEHFLGLSSVEVTLGVFNELYQKYKYMEQSFEKSKESYKSKIPEIIQTLELVRIMKAKKENDEAMIANYSLCDTIFAKADIDLSSEKVCLWIGASTMVEYTFDEAIDLLETQLNGMKTKILEVDEDLYFLRGNCITVEVNMSRLFNHNVMKKKQMAAAAGVSTST